MAYEKEFDVRVNKEGDREEVILREAQGVASMALYPSGDEQGYFKNGKARLTITMVEKAPDDSGPVETTTKGKK